MTNNTSVIPIKKRLLDGLNLFDKCKKCGSSRYECKRCFENEFYRHIDDKNKMKSNMSIIRNRRFMFLNTLIELNYKPL